MQHPSPSEEVMRAVYSAVLDRQTSFIELEEGTACILPMEDYIRFMGMKDTLTHVVTYMNQRNIAGVVHTVETFSKWLLAGGGEVYTLEEERSDG